MIAGGMPPALARLLKLGWPLLMAALAQRQAPDDLGVLWEDCDELAAIVVYWLPRAQLGALQAALAEIGSPRLVSLETPCAGGQIQIALVRQDGLLGQSAACRMIDPLHSGPGGCA